MIKIIFITSFVILSFLGCENTNEPFNYERDTPVWLKEKINNISSNQEYWGTIVYRYELNKKYYYHIMIPISSCGYCELFDENGDKILFGDDEFSKFLQDKKNELIIWEWDNSN